MHELKHYIKEKLIIAGCDEAGRGCLAGPVFAAAVILPQEYLSLKINDSKKLSEKDRYELRKEVESYALSWAIGIVDNQEIDRINILNASFCAMNQAVKKMKIKPDLLIIDGNRFISQVDIPFECIIKGDAKYYSIAAASILAKTYRDDFMKKIHNEYPDYNWNKNKGYPTEFHRKAVEKNGITKYHRKTFCQKYLQTSIKFL